MLLMVTFGENNFGDTFMLFLEQIGYIVSQKCRLLMLVPILVQTMPCLYDWRENSSGRALIINVICKQ